MKFIRLFFRVLLWLLVLAVLYVGGSLLHGTITDYQPEERLALEAYQSSDQTLIQDSVVSFYIWNIGYGGLGAQSNFFYDSNNSNKMLVSNDKMVRSPKALVQEYTAGIETFFEQRKADFYLLQEVDFEARRSYFENQFDRYRALLPAYAAFFAPNFDVQRLPIPVLEPFDPIGRVHGGLATYSRYQPSMSTRYQLPGEYDWPIRTFQLDRCISYHRYPTVKGKDLVVLNIHNSAFDKGGFIKKQQMEYLKTLAEEEYARGNYVIAGGDWNQCPPGFAFDAFMPGRTQGHTQINIEADFMPKDWRWIYDRTVPSNRKVPNVYDEAETFRTIIDFYLTSPNVVLRKVEGVDLNFQFSDHQPVYMEVELN